MVSASSSLPTPDSPSTSTLTSLRAMSVRSGVAAPGVGSGTDISSSAERWVDGLAGPGAMMTNE